MLVLSRKPNESIVFPQQEIEITVLEIRGETVRLGINAPASVVVHREEVWRRINAQKQAAQGIDQEKRQTGEQPAEVTTSQAK